MKKQVRDKTKELLREMVRIRKISEITQTELGEMTGLCQPVISRIENGGVIPNLETLLSLLEPMGKTLKIIDIEE